MNAPIRWLLAVPLALALLSGCGSGGSSASAPGGGGGGGLASNIDALTVVLLSAGTNASVNEQINATRIQTDQFGDPTTPQATTWNPNHIYYRYVVSSAVSTITVTPFAQDTRDPPTIRVSGGGLNNVVVPTDLSSPAITLTFGSELNIITVESIAADGRTNRTYTLRITRLPPTAAEIGTLQLSSSEVVLDPPFNREVKSYTATAPFSVSSLTVRPTAQDSNATMTLAVNGGAPTPIVSGATSAPIPLTIPTPTVISLKVTATDGQSTEEYTLTVTREGSADLIALAPNVGALQPAFSPAQTDYTSSQDYFRSEVGLRPTAAEGAAAVIEIQHDNGVQQVQSGFLSQPIVLCQPDDQPCETQVDVHVASSNNVVNKTYSVTFIRETAPPFQQTAYVKASTIGADDRFGSAVALSGDTLAIGAPREHRVNPSLGGPGAVHVYVRNAPNGPWTHQARLSFVDEKYESQFGTSVALSGDTLVAGAPLEDGHGAVYVYTRSGSTWTQQARLAVPLTLEFEQFGLSVAVDGDVLAIGAPQEGDTDAFYGAVYVYTRSGDTWSGPVRLEASDPQNASRFGASVAIAGDTLAVGAETKNGGRGAVYIFQRVGNAWVEQAPVLQGTLDGFSGFGHSLALSGDRLAVGAPNERGVASGTPNTGAAYVFTRSAGVWDPAPKRLVASNGGEGDQFGTSIALSGGRVLVGARDEDSNGTGVNNNTAKANNSAENSGAAYVFDLSGGEWTEIAYLKPSNTNGSSCVVGRTPPCDVGDQFGVGVALEGDTLVVGALGEDSNGTQSNNSVIDSGAAYVFSPFTP